MKVSAGLLRSKHTHFLLSIFLAFVWGIFSYVHVLAFKETGEWMYLLFCSSETLVAIFYLIRTEPQTVSIDPVDWALAICATFAPFLFSPANWGLLPEAKPMIAAGSAVLIAGLFSLNRSLGLVAAKRQIKTGGMYRFVRHPLYASYLLSFTGYVLMNTSVANVAVYVATMTLLFFRLLREERHLSLDGSYRDYMEKVRYRVIPLVF
jgi:protein-S-isoprenylcysteine O-methyltransferase Ste14